MMVSTLEVLFLPLQLYLNGANDTELGGFKGGATRFLDRRGNVRKSVVPLTGCALVFEQQEMELYHDGEKLESGKKVGYV
jgi:hypothetical protein